MGVEFDSGGMHGERAEEIQQVFEEELSPELPSMRKMSLNMKGRIEFERERSTGFALMLPSVLPIHPAIPCHR
jgi:hypothetical protein